MAHKSVSTPKLEYIMMLFGQRTSFHKLRTCGRVSWWNGQMHLQVTRTWEEENGVKKMCFSSVLKINPHCIDLFQQINIYIIIELNVAGKEPRTDMN